MDPETTDLHSNIYLWEEDLKLAESLIHPGTLIDNIVEAMRNQNKIIHLMAREILRLHNKLESNK